MPAENFETAAKPLATEHQNNLLADAYDWVCDNPGKTAGIVAVGVLLLSKGRTLRPYTLDLEKEVALRKDLMNPMREAAEELKTAAPKSYFEVIAREYRSITSKRGMEEDLLVVPLKEMKSNLTSSEDLLGLKLDPAAQRAKEVSEKLLEKLHEMLDRSAAQQAKQITEKALGRTDLIFDGKAPNAKAAETIKNWLQSHGHEIKYTDSLSGRLGQP